MTSDQTNHAVPLAAQPAIDGVLAAFKNRPLVGIGDYHGLAQQSAFYAELVRDPRFARDVGNVVVEFGGAASQNIVDRYVAGETVHYDELRKVWTDVVGWVPTVLDLGLIRFYAEVRAVNLHLPPDHRIRVWLGEPEIDWTKIKTREELNAFLGSRDSHAAKIITDNILSKNRKALVIYGTGHFLQGLDQPSLRDLIETDYPRSLFLVVPYTGFVDAASIEAFESQFGNWPTPALVSLIKGTSLQDMLPGFQVIEVSKAHGSQELSDAQRVRLARLEIAVAGFTADALLYLGPAASLAASPIDPSIYLDLDFLKEISRRSELQVGKPISLSDAVNTATTMPRQIRHLRG
ncbi:MAG TPA: hypothetical protein VMT72_05570 [Pseudolabrys sp.]|nr:hypothetical protein [Pseudolabrys sp.]